MQSGLRKKPPSNHVVAKNYSKLWSELHQN
jgi:hypothetical protein